MQSFTDCQQFPLESVLERGEYLQHAMNPGDLEWFVYVVECRDKSFYTGIAKDVAQRIEQHNEGKGAKFTRGRKWKLAYSKRYLSKSVAMREEYKLKKNIKLRNKIKLKFKKNENFNTTSL